MLATPSALTDRGTERQGYRQAHVQAMPGEAAGAELPLPEAGGSGSRTGETAPAPLSDSKPFSGFLSPPSLYLLIVPSPDFPERFFPPSASFPHPPAPGFHESLEAADSIFLALKL